MFDAYGSHCSELFVIPQGERHFSPKINFGKISRDIDFHVIYTKENCYMVYSWNSSLAKLGYKNSGKHFSCYVLIRLMSRSFQDFHKFIFFENKYDK